MLQKCERRLQLLFSSLSFSSLRCSFLAYFERLWKRAMELSSLVFHEFELPKALPWTIYSSPSFFDCFGDQKAIKTPKLNTIWLETIARVLNMSIELKGNNYYSKVFKRVNYKLSNSTFWIVINEINNFSLTEQYFPNNLVIMPTNPLYAYPILHLDFPNFKHHDMESNPTQ